jgi:exosortase/archaeosortase family protein
MRADRSTMFLFAALAWSLALFALLRSPWVEAELLLPLTLLQQGAADFYAGRPPVPVSVTVECSAADVLALCLAAILSCPVPWRARLTGALGGVGFVLALNTMRIASLGHAADRPAVFDSLHLRVWPAILVLATAGYVFVWMRAALAARPATTTAVAGESGLVLLRRFAPRAAALLVVFALCGPWIAGSETLVAGGAWTARAAAGMLTSVGLAATASGNVLATSRGGFVVTPECLATVLIPLFVAGVFTVPLSWPRRALALLAAPPLFAALAVARLLLLALPPVLAGSPLFLVHGFHQAVLGVLAVVLFALWRDTRAPARWSRAAAHAGAGLAVAVAFALCCGLVLTRAVLAAARAVGLVATHTVTDLAPAGDDQGALALLPVFQASLLLALGWAAGARGRRLAWAFGALFVSQVALLVIVGEVAAHADLLPHALFVRAWAIAVPVALTLALFRGTEAMTAERATRRPAVDGAV